MPDAIRWFKCKLKPPKNLQFLAGYENPAPGSPNLKLMLDGIKAYLAKPIKQAAPMTIDILKDIANLVNWGSQFQVCVYAATLTGFYMILRCSNLVPLSTNKFNPHEQFTTWHVGHR